MSNLLVGIAAGGPPTWALTKTLLSLKGPGMGGYNLTLAEGMNVAEARNYIVEKFLASPYRWLLMLDRDAQLHPLTAVRLMSWNQPIVAALTFTRQQPPMPTVYHGADPQHVSGPIGFRIQFEDTRAWLHGHPELVRSEAVLLEPRPDDALREVDFTGMHCTLIRRDVFDGWAGPWFERVHPAGGPAGAGEDYYFCRRAAERGHTIHVDRSVVAGHLWGDRCIGGLDFLAYDSITNWETGSFHFGGNGGN